MATLRVGYHKAWGVVLVVAGVADLLVYTSTRTLMHLMLGGLLLVIGVLYLSRPFLVIGDGVIQVKNLLGITMRRFSFGSLAELGVEPDAIVIGEGRGSQRLKVSRLLIARSDMQRLDAAVKQAASSGSA